MRRNKSASTNKINKTNDARVSCRVPMDLYVRIDKIANRLGVDASDVVRMGLNQVLPSFEK